MTENPPNGMYRTMIKYFKTVAYLEGISLLLLLGVAMPLKYIWAMPLAVRIVGMAHGLLFVAYVGLLTYLHTEHNWPAKRTALAFVASMVPFGVFFFNHYENQEPT